LNFNLNNNQNELKDSKNSLDPNFLDMDETYVLKNQIFGDFSLSDDEFL